MNIKKKEILSNQKCPKCGSFEKDEFWQSDKEKQIYSTLCLICREIYRVDLENMKVY